MTPKQFRKIGQHFAFGVMEIVALCFVAGYIMGLFAATDDCDASRFDRCGMKVVTDHKTGRQYLLSPYGGMIERGV